MTDPAAAAGRPRRLLHTGTAIVLIVGVLVTGGLSIGASSLRSDNEDRLLQQRTNEVAAVLTVAIGGIQTPLAAAATIADVTNGGQGGFTRLMDPLAAAKQPFVSASLWDARSSDVTPIVVSGSEPELLKLPPARIREFLGKAATAPKISILDLLGERDRRLGYAYAQGAPNARYVVYAEAALPRDRRASVESNSAFSDLDYALYLGDRPVTNRLLASSRGTEVPLGGRIASTTISFGDAKLLLVLSPRKDLGGSLLQRLPWLLALGGAALVLAAGLVTERLIRGREEAERLAAELESIAIENAELYAAQRTVAQTLQQSLLPASLPDLAGLDLAVRYVAGVEGVDIGGDWYDVMETVPGSLFFVVGDVSGRGLPAATIMASLRYSIRAYAAQGDGPAEVLTHLAGMVGVVDDGHFATVLCGCVDVDAHTVTIANAGHLAALVVSPEGREFLDTPVGVPVGVAGGPPYEEVTVTLPPRATLIAYTDGLVERRGENLDVGLERLRQAASADDTPLDDLLSRIVERLTPDGSDDDTAVLGMRWHG